MNLQELKKDLINKTNDEGYFANRLFEYDTVKYQRRSFDDLYKYYKKYDVTEEMLLQALYEVDMGGKICPSLKKIVFCRISYFRPEDNSWRARYKGVYYDFEDKYILNSKYTVTYLNELFAKIKK